MTLTIHDTTVSVWGLMLAYTTPTLPIQSSCRIPLEPSPPIRSTHPNNTSLPYRRHHFEITMMDHSTVLINTYINSHNHNHNNNNSSNKSHLHNSSSSNSSMEWGHMSTNNRHATMDWQVVPATTYPLLYATSLNISSQQHLRILFL